MSAARSTAVGMLVGALALATSGCRTARALLADPHEYAAYRATRTRASLEERLRAAEEYLERHPDGDFAGDVRRAYARGEGALWTSKRGSAAGLRAYLEALPRGAHAPEARRALAAREAASVDLLGRRARATEDRLAAAAADRARAQDELALWVRRFAAPGALEAPLAEAPADLVVAWALALPAPRCEPLEGGGRRCRKLVERGFTLPGDGASPSGGARALVLEIVIDEGPAGAACAVTLAGPAAFSRREEAATLAPADSGERRERAVLAAASTVRSALETAGAGACVETPRARGGIDLVCGARIASVRPAEEPGGDDVVTLGLPAALRAGRCVRD